MNIFVTSTCPIKSAQALDDKRLIKMVLETAQLLSTTHRVLGTAIADEVYKTTHVNHPCAVWCRSGRTPYDWLVRHFEALLTEYTYRYNKIHACSPMLTKFKKVVPSFDFLGWVPFANCTPHKEIANIEEAYRLTMKEKWVSDNTTNRPAVWTKRGYPDWLYPKEQLQLGV